MRTVMERPERLAVSIEELHEQTGLSKQFIRGEIRRGKLGAAKVGRRVLLPLECIREWLAAARKS